jgi:hypothetical protein
MLHLIGDVAEGVWKNSLLSKVIRRETEDDRLFSTERIRLFDSSIGRAFILFN